jgi:hypothetical protein
MSTFGDLMLFAALKDVERLLDLEEALKWIAESSARWTILHLALHPDLRQAGDQRPFLDFLLEEVARESM